MLHLSKNNNDNRFDITPMKKKPVANRWAGIGMVEKQFCDRLMDGCIRQTDGWVDRWMDGWRDGWMVQPYEKWTNGQMDGGMGQQMDGQIDGLIDKPTDQQTTIGT